MHRTARHGRGRVLGLVDGIVGVPDGVERRGAGHRDRDPDAGRQHEHVAVVLLRLLELLDDPVAEGITSVGCCEVRTITTNSSPPRRPTNSPLRTHRVSVAAIRASTLSPTACPWVSLTLLKASRSTNSTGDVVGVVGDELLEPVEHGEPVGEPGRGRRGSPGRRAAPRTRVRSEMSCAMTAVTCSSPAR